MSAALILPDLSTAEAFVAWMETRPQKLEMAHGRLVLVTGASNAHVTIAGNVLTGLRTKLRGKRCRPFSSDFLVEIGPKDRFYPDVSVACDEARNYTDRPVMVVEVLSESTERFDYSVKLPAYLGKPGLAYVLYLSQVEAVAQLWRPGEPGGHEPILVEGLKGEIDLAALGIRLSMAELYADVSLAGTSRATRGAPASSRARSGVRVRSPA